MENNEHIWTILMAGGLGSRFWPVAGADSPKQFLDVMGTGHTMLQLTFARMATMCRRENIIIVTGEQYVDRVRQQVPGLALYQVLGEPLRRNTAPCIAYAAAIIERLDPQATVIVAPSDHAIFNEEQFRADLLQAVRTATEHRWIVCIGAQPVRPDTSYGYIQFDDAPSLPDAPNLHKAITFTEKPPLELARQFIASGEFFWNAGLLVWSIGTLREAYREHLPSISESFASLQLGTPRSELERIYSQCEAVSVDNGIMEKATNVHVLAAGFGWSDVETWESLHDAVPQDADRNASIGGTLFAYDSTDNVVVVPGGKGRTVVIEGLHGYIVAASDDTLMICRRESEGLVFKFTSDVELRQLIEKR